MSSGTSSLAREVEKQDDFNPRRFFSRRRPSAAEGFRYKPMIFSDTAQSEVVEEIQRLPF
jgi:hypothetical protein